MSILSSMSNIIEESKRIYEETPKRDFDICETYGETGENILAKGDCLDFMKYLIESEEMRGKIKLIYIDPPFFTGMKQEAVITVPGMNESVSVPAYTDIWENGRIEYYTMIAARLRAMRDLLAEDGSIWVHIDWRTTHYIRILLDEIFGEDNFVNEIIWTYKSGGSTKKRFARKHDTLLFYSKSKKYFFNVQKEKSYNRGLKPYRFKGVEEFCDETGWYTMVNMKDVWNIDMVGRTSSERTGYATQKPEALLRRIIESCSKEGDICADFFGGSGSFAAAAQKTGRRFITCDGGDLAVGMTAKRLNEIGTSFDVLVENIEIDCNYLKKDDEISCIGDIIYVGAFIDSRENDTGAIDMWSVDFNYDGSVHKPDYVSVRHKSVIEKQIQLPQSYGKVSIVFYDILGRRTHYVY